VFVATKPALRPRELAPSPGDIRSTGAVAPLLQVRALLRRGWKRTASGTVGEFDTDQILKLAASDAVAGAVLRMLEV